MTEPRIHRPRHAKVPTLGRLSSAKRGYGRRWRRYCEGFKQQHPVCEGYIKDEHGLPVHTPRCRYLTQHVDHIKPVTGPDDPLFWAPSNHQGLSHVCHSAKTIREKGARR